MLNRNQFRVAFGLGPKRRGPRQAKGQMTLEQSAQGMRVDAMLLALLSLQAATPLQILALLRAATLGEGHKKVAEQIQSSDWDALAKRRDVGDVLAVATQGQAPTRLFVYQPPTQTAGQP